VAFDADYREEITLADGERVTLRLVRPADKELFVRGIQRMSPESRYLRFFTAKERLSDGELRYLTEVDQERHFALGAVRLDADGHEEGLGVARFVALDDAPGVAEPAVAVIDSMQRKGLGRALLARLLAAARERGVERFRCEVLAENTGMLEMLQRVAPGSVAPAGAGLVVVELPIPPAEDDESKLSPIYRLFVLVAERLVQIRRMILG
jgi:GNAT superfamily N-acetyltransferase